MFLIVFLVILNIIFTPESPKRAPWVGGVRYLGQVPKNTFLATLVALHLTPVSKSVGDS